MNLKLSELMPKAKALLGYAPPNISKCSIICITEKHYLLEELASHILQQTLVPDIVSIITVGYDDKQKNDLKSLLSSLPCVHINSAIGGNTLGDNHNQAMSYIDGGVIFVFNDTDIYMPNYCKGQLANLKFKNASISMKCDPVITSSDKKVSGWLYPYVLKDDLFNTGSEGSLCFTYELYGVIKFKPVRDKVISAFQKRAIDKGFKVVSADPFNYAIVTNEKDDSAEYGLRFNDVDLKDVEL